MSYDYDLPPFVAEPPPRVRRRVVRRPPSECRAHVKKVYGAGSIRNRHMDYRCEKCGRSL